MRLRLRGPLTVPKPGCSLWTMTNTRIESVVSVLKEEVSLLVNGEKLEVASLLLDIVSRLRALFPIEGLSSEEKVMADAGRTIDTIKSYRNRTGTTLKDAKDVHDAYKYPGGVP